MAVRAGQTRTAENEHSDPVFLTSSFVFSDAAEAARRFADRRRVTSIHALPTPQYGRLNLDWQRWNNAAALRGNLQARPERDANTITTANDRH